MPTDYNKNGRMYAEGMIVGPADKYAIVFDDAGTFKVVQNPFGAAPIEVVKGDASGVFSTAIGSGGATAKVGATFYASFNGTTGFQPSVTGAAKIVDLVSIPANTLTVGRTLVVDWYATHAANGNTVTVAVNLGGTGAVGATVSGGTNISSFALATSGGISIHTSSTLIQLAANQQTMASVTTNATAATNTNVSSTGDTTTALQLNLTMNAATAATDVTVLGWIVYII